MTQKGNVGLVVENNIFHCLVLVKLPVPKMEIIQVTQLTTQIKTIQMKPVSIVRNQVTLFKIVTDWQKKLAEEAEIIRTEKMPPGNIIARVVCSVDVPKTI